MTPYVDKVFEKLLAILQDNDMPTSLTENAAIALGRLGLGACDELAPHLETFASPFLDALNKVSETDEKESAYRGFVMVVGRNPQAMESCLIQFFKCVARYRKTGKELDDLFRNVGVESAIQNVDPIPRKNVLTKTIDPPRLQRCDWRLERIHGPAYAGRSRTVAGEVWGLKILREHL